MRRIDDRKLYKDLKKSKLISKEEVDEIIHRIFEDVLVKKT